MIIIKNLKKTYDKIVAVDIKHCVVENNDFVIIQGESGSGKSTLLKAIGGLLPYEKGSIEIDGIKLEEMNESQLSRYRRDNIGIVFQQFQLIEYLDAINNVLVPMRYQKGYVDYRKGLKLLEIVGLAARKNHKPSQLSGGQAQRVAIARAISNKPKLLLCDEPTGSLDYDNSLKIMEILKTINNLGITIIMVTHQDNLIGYGKHLWRMRKGKIINA